MKGGTARPEEWFRESRPEDLSSALSDTPFIRGVRKRALKNFLEGPVESDPLYKKYSHLSGVDLQGVDLRWEGKSVTAPRCLAGEVIVVHDSSGTRIDVSPELASAGLKALPLSEIWKMEEDILSLFISNGGGPGAEERPTKFEAMNLALMNRGFYLDIPDRFSFPVHVKEMAVLSGKDEGLVVRRLLRAGTMTRLFHTEELYSTNEEQNQRLYSSSTHLMAGEDSDTLCFTAHAPDSRVVSFYNRRLETSVNSRTTWIFSGLDGFRTTLKNTSRLKERGGTVSDYQVFFGDGEHSIASSVNVFHEGDDTRSRSMTRGVFKEDSRGTFTGMMKIESNVRKVFSYLAEHAMLLSKSARAETIPGMEILSAEDVKASHSSSVATLDPERVFYVQSRGVDEGLAARLIAEGFLARVIAEAPLAGLDNALAISLDSRWTGKHLGWAGHHLGWVGRGIFHSLTPSEATWQSVGEKRMDYKLR